MRAWVSGGSCARPTGAATHDARSLLRCRWLVHGYHARPELQRHWDAQLLEDLGIDRERFRNEFIFDIFIKKVVVGEMSLIEALDRRLPSLGYRGSPMAFVNYWLSRDSELNQPLLDIIRPTQGAR